MSDLNKLLEEDLRNEFEEVKLLMADQAEKLKKSKPGSIEAISIEYAYTSLSRRRDDIRAKITKLLSK